MSKWFGKIGFGETEEVEPGVWKENIIENEYFGDVYDASRSYQLSGSHINDDITMSVRISVLSNHYLNQNLDNIKYVEYMGTTWHVKSVVPAYPRLIITLGGVYNVQRNESSD